MPAILIFVIFPAMSVTVACPEQAATPPRRAIRVVRNEEATDNTRDRLSDREKEGMIASVTERVRFADILLINDTVDARDTDMAR
jgi:hypothetical protein